MEAYIQKRPGVHGHRYKYLSLRCLQKTPWMPAWKNVSLLLHTPPSTEPLAWMPVPRNNRTVFPTCLLNYYG